MKKDSYDLDCLTKITKKEHIYKTLENQLKKTNNGKSLVTAIRLRHKRQWLWSKRGLTPGNKVRYIQALSGCLPTKVNKTRGIIDRRVKTCSRCKSNEIEHDMHILSRCNYNKDVITKRHDHLVKKILKELVKVHPQTRVWRERLWGSGTELQRPDITMVEGDRATIIEVTLPYETSEEYLERRSEKIQKYQRLVEEELQQVQCTEGEVIPIVLRALGTMTRNTLDDLKKLKLQQQRDALQMTIATGGMNILNNHFRRNDFA